MHADEAAHVAPVERCVQQHAQWVLQSLCVFMAGVRHKSSTLFQFEIARDRGPEALVGAIHL